LLAAGYHVISLDRKPGHINSPHLHEMQVDLTDVEATRSLSLDVARRFPATTVIHNAGAVRLGPHGITANVVAPGPIEATEVFHDIIPKDSPKLPGIIESIPVKRLGRPADVARAVMFFADPQAGFVTGQTLFVCGGTSVGSIVF
jgi:NAD(P)-dependent dehydrogenase (short-subunit alcohol dehydrogenase family)